MFAYLKGILVSANPSQVVVDVQDDGYLFIPYVCLTVTTVRRASSVYTSCRS